MCSGRPSFVRLPASHSSLHNFSPAALSASIPPHRPCTRPSRSSAGAPRGPDLPRRGRRPDQARGAQGQAGCAHRRGHRAPAWQAAQQRQRSAAGRRHGGEAPWLSQTAQAGCDCRLVAHVVAHVGFKLVAAPSMQSERFPPCACPSALPPPCTHNLQGRLQALRALLDYASHDLEKASPRGFCCCCLGSLLCVSRRAWPAPTGVYKQQVRCPLDFQPVATPAASPPPFCRPARRPRCSLPCASWR